MTRKRRKPVIAWYDVLSSARPLILITIELLLKTKRFAPYSSAFRLLGLAVDTILAEGDNSLVASAIRKTSQQLDTLAKAKPPKRRAVLTALKTQISAL